MKNRFTTEDTEKFSLRVLCALCGFKLTPVVETGILYSVMAMQTAATKPEIIYPETDGQPMAENTKQAEVMMTIKENLDALFADRPDVFVAIDLFWYPVEGRPDIRQAPDVMVVLGRPKGLSLIHISEPTRPY